MRIQKQNYTAIAAITLMMLLILDSKTAFSGAYEGISLCLTTVMPSLFPFILLSGVLMTALAESDRIKFPFLSKFCRIPSGSEMILLTGLIGGYPVGARCIGEAYQNGNLSKADAHRMLGFSSNAGPAFIFGMTANLFHSPMTAWILWAIHIISALIVGMLLPGKATSNYVHGAKKKASMSEALVRSVKTMGIICGWIVIFRVIIAFMERWVLWLVPTQWAVGLYGMTELSNGIVSLRKIDSEMVRFIFASCFLAFGGICVWMQTASVVADLGAGLYFPGKLLQTGISLLLSLLTSFMLFSGEFDRVYLIFFVVIIAVILAAIILWKKVVAIHKKLLYNVGK